MPSLTKKALESYYQIKYAKFLKEKLAKSKFGAAAPKLKSSLKSPTTIKNEGLRPQFDHRMPNNPNMGTTSTNLAAMHSPPPLPASQVGATIKTESMQPELPKPVKS